MGFKIKNEDGFTMIELLMVFAVIGILAQMATFFALDIRKRTFDSVALADGKNLMTMAAGTFIALEDVDFTHDPPDGSNIGTTGTVDTGFAPRPPVFTMSPGVRAEIVGSSGLSAGSGFIDAFIFHESGTDDPGALSGNGKREFYFSLDEMTSAITSPSL